MKPKLIIEKYVKPNCLQIMVRIDSKKQIKYFLRFIDRFVKSKINRDILKDDLNNIYKYDKTIFSSNHIQEEKITLDYIITDKGKKEKIAFIFLVVYCEKNDFKVITDYQVEDFFQSW